VVTITPEALSVIQRVCAHPRTEPTSGLRIAREDPSSPLQVHAVQSPQPGDTMVERRGARLYLGPDASRRLAGRELDAVTDPEGRVQFILRAAA
jgi:Fe-S cluster assembly iron-binding protein IscA